MVGHDNKNGVRPKGLLFRVLEKLAETPVGVFHHVVARAIRVFRNAALGIGVGLVIRHRQDGGEERLVGLAQGAELPDGPRV